LDAPAVLQVLAHGVVHLQRQGFVAVQVVVTRVLGGRRSAAHPAR
jgi:hypothetical protein